MNDTEIRRTSNRRRERRHPVGLLALVATALIALAPAAESAFAASAADADPGRDRASSTRPSSGSSSSSSSSDSGSRSSTSSSSSSSSSRTAVRRSGSSGSSGSSSRGSRGAARTRPDSGSSSGSSASSGSRTRVERNYDRYPAGRGYNPRHRSPHHYPYYPGYHDYFYHYGYWDHPYYWWCWPWGWTSYVRVDLPRVSYGSSSPDRLGALDLDISPEKADVYLNGELIGEADDFDGWPDYLWLREGVYDVVFYKEGYETLARQYVIRPGYILGVDDDLRRGEATPPEELIAKSTANRDERLRRNEERRAEVEQRERDADAVERPLDVRGEPGLLLVQVEPGDASVYLDGRFLGTGRELADLHSGLIVDPGRHTLEVVRPGYESDELEIEVETGEEVTVRVTLEES